jgi:3'-phosphoadenosine 5'-phosphosulfate sulfotransferase (PAPS reductase)/FAD synthetase
MDKSLIEEACEHIKYALKAGPGIVGFSGGKDAIVCADLINQIAPGTKMVCETSFLFPEQLEDIKQLAKRMELNVEYHSSLSDNWLTKNREIIFTSNTVLRSKSFSIRQQRTIKRFAKRESAKVTFTGRRKDHNSVKSPIYQTKQDGLQCHPLTNWSEQDVWDYFNYTGIPIPMIYKTRFGIMEGNAPFYALNRKFLHDSVDKCWEVVNEVSDKHNFYKKFKPFVK